MTDTKAAQAQIKHWIDSPKLRARFWANAKELDLTNEQVYDALGVESIHDYPGTSLEAEAAIRDAALKNKAANEMSVMFEGRENLMDQLNQEPESEIGQLDLIPPVEEPEDEEEIVQFVPEVVDDNVLERLAEPFPLDAHSFKPAATSKDKTRCLALAYASTRAYTDRLNAVVGLNWHDRLEALNEDGSAMICHLTILNTTRSDVGEKEKSDKNTATSAAAQAFKRACAKFGLGRYLYSLPQEWVEYDGYKITPNGMQHLRKMLEYHTGQGKEAPPKQRQPQQMTPALAAKVTTRKGTALGTLKADALDMILENADKPDVGPKRAEAARVLINWLQENCADDAGATYNARMGIK